MDSWFFVCMVVSCVFVDSLLQYYEFFTVCSFYTLCPTLIPLCTMCMLVLGMSVDSLLCCVLKS